MQKKFKKRTIATIYEVDARWRALTYINVRQNVAA